MLTRLAETVSMPQSCNFNAEAETSERKVDYIDNIKSTVNLTSHYITLHYTYYITRAK